jgi:hypothetical protein
MAEKKQRVTFSQQHWEILQEIIIHGEGGRFLRALRVRDTSTNLTKAEIWEKITQYFIQVGVFYCVFMHVPVTLCHVRPVYFF